MSGAGTLLIWTPGDCLGEGLTWPFDVEGELGTGLEPGWLVEGGETVEMPGNADGEGTFAGGKLLMFGTPGHLCIIKQF